MYIYTIKEKRIYKLERELEVHEMIWRKDREGRNDVIIYSFSGLVQGDNVGLILGNLQFL